MKTRLKHLPVPTFKRLLLVLATLASVANTEEESFLAEATMLDRGKFSSVYSTAPDELFGDGFKSKVVSFCCA